MASVYLNWRTDELRRQAVSDLAATSSTRRDRPCSRCKRYQAWLWSQTTWHLRVASQSASQSIWDADIASTSISLSVQLIRTAYQVERGRMWCSGQYGATLTTTSPLASRPALFPWRRAWLHITIINERTLPARHRYYNCINHRNNWKLISHVSDSQITPRLGYQSDLLVVLYSTASNWLIN